MTYAGNGVNLNDMRFEVYVNPFPLTHILFRINDRILYKNNFLSFFDGKYPIICSEIHALNE